MPHRRTVLFLFLAFFFLFPFFPPSFVEFFGRLHVTWAPMLRVRLSWRSWSWHVHNCHVLRIVTWPPSCHFPLPSLCLVRCHARPLLLLREVCTSDEHFLPIPTRPLLWIKTLSAHSYGYRSCAKSSFDQHACKQFNVQYKRALRHLPLCINAFYL